jgi:phospholipase C
MAGLADIETFVVVMMENRSFDHVLGALAMPQHGGLALEGLAGADTDPRFANVYDHQIYRPFPTADVRLLHDLPHARGEVTTQLAAPPSGTPTMSGFVQAYVDMNHSIIEQPPPMGYLAPTAAFMSSFLARNYLVCDHWFAALPADTHPNRVMAVTGSPTVDDTKARLIPYQNLVFDWLTAHRARWRVYHSGFSFFLLFGLFDLVLSDNFRSVRQLASDFENEDDATRPHVIFVEPEYGDSPVHFGFTPNDNHPPEPIGPGESFLRDVYAALINSPRWAKTMLIVVHDEHGGFFDHVPPPAIRMPLPTGAMYPTPFDSAGVRVPALIASPYVSASGVHTGQLDHTSILQMFAEKFAGGPRNYSDDVTRRLDQGIGSASAVLSEKARPDDPPQPPKTPVSAQQLLRATKPVMTDNQKAFALAAASLDAYDHARTIRKFPEIVHLES